MRRWKLLGGGLLIVALAVLVVWLVARGRARQRAEELEALLARQDDAALPQGLDALLERVTPEQVERYTDYAAWAELPLPEPWQARSRDLPSWTPFVFGDAPEPPSGAREDHEACRAHAEALGLLLDAGPLPLALDVDLAQQTRRTGVVPPYTERGATLKLWPVLHAADWLAIETALADDPTRAFARLDALVASFDAPASIMEVSVSQAVLWDLSHACVVDALRHGAGSARLDRWLAEPPPPFERLAGALRGMRLMLTVPMAQAIVDSRGAAAREMLPFWNPDGPLGWYEREMYFLWDAPRDAVRLVRMSARMEDWLRGRLDDGPLEEALAWADQEQGLLAADATTLLRFTQYWIEQRALHRAARLIVRLLRMHAAGDLPEDDAALRRALGERLVDALLEGTPRDALLVYERPGVDTIRVTVDPHRPFPEVLRNPDGSRLPVPSRQGAQSAGTRAFLAPGTVEVRLPER